MNKVGSFMMGRELADLLEKYKAVLQHLLEVVDKELGESPPGYLQIKKRGTRTWYQHRNPKPGAKDVYLNKAQRKTVYALAQKRYDRQLKHVVEEELSFVRRAQQLLAGGNLTFRQLILVYEKLPETLKPFVRPHVLPDGLFVEEWLRKYREGASGEDFKSKSEWLVRGILEKYRRPYVYEPKLYLKGYGLVRPDFVILNVRTRQTFYMEHFGMMDNPEYCRKALAKLEAYHRNGFYEGVNLIITMESGEHPMNPQEVEALVKKYLL